MTELERRPITDLLTEAAAALNAAEASDTTAVLTAAWRGFCIAGAAGALLSYCADQSVGPAGTRIEVLEPAGHPSGGSHTASASESVSAANTRSGEALMTRTAVSGRLIAGAPVALVDHARAERPGLDQV